MMVFTTAFAMAFTCQDRKQRWLVGRRKRPFMHQRVVGRRERPSRHPHHLAPVREYEAIQGKETQGYRYTVW
jgi:hypothetical protein